MKLFRMLNKSVLSHISFYLEDDDYKPIDFNSEIVSFTCQLKKYNTQINIITHINVCIHR